MERVNGVDVPQSLEDACDPRRLALLVYDMQVGILGQIADGDEYTVPSTIEDPVVFTKSWKISLPLYRRVERNAQLLDFKCVEFVEELMYGQYRKKPLTR